jgi:hypothetical protein
VEADERDWKRAGEMVMRRREYLGLSREDVAARAEISARTLSNYEHYRLPIKGRIPGGYLRVVEVIGWAPGSLEAVLAGGEPALAEPPVQQRSQVDKLTELLATYAVVQEFGSLCERAGGDPAERAAFEGAARRLVDSVPGMSAARIRRSDLVAAASRPHDLGGPIPLDDLLAAHRAVDAAEADE